MRKKKLQLNAYITCFGCLSINFTFKFYSTNDKLLLYPNKPFSLFWNLLIHQYFEKASLYALFFLIHFATHYAEKGVNFLVWALNFDRLGKGLHKQNNVRTRVKPCSYYEYYKWIHRLFNSASPLYPKERYPHTYPSPCSIFLFKERLSVLTDLHSGGEMHAYSL